MDTHANPSIDALRGELVANTAALRTATAYRRAALLRRRDEIKLALGGAR